MIVAEASAIVHVLVGAPVSEELLDVLARDELHSPALVDFEVASALRGHARAGKLDQRRVRRAVADFVDLRIERYQMTHLLGRLLDLSHNFTAYDAAYVVLAQALGCPLVTSDAKLTGATRLGVAVRVFPSSD